MMRHNFLGIVVAFLVAAVSLAPAWGQGESPMPEPTNGGQSALPVRDGKTYVVPDPSGRGQSTARTSGGSQWHVDNQLPARFNRLHADNFSAGTARVDRLYVGGQRVYPLRRTVTRRSSGYNAGLSQRFAGEVRRIDQRLTAAESRLGHHGQILHDHERRLTNSAKEVEVERARNDSQDSELNELRRRVETVERQTLPPPATTTPAPTPPATTVPSTPAPTTAPPPAATPAPGGPSLPGGAEPAPGQPSVHVPPRVAPDGQYLQAVYITPVAAGSDGGDAKPDGLVVRVFVDSNFDGIHDQAEGLAAGVPVTVTTPDGKTWQLATGQKGEWTLPAAVLVEGTYSFRAREKAVTAEWPKGKEILVPFEVYGDTLQRIVDALKSFEAMKEKINAIERSAVKGADLRRVVKEEVGVQFKGFEARQAAKPAATAGGLPWWQLGFLVFTVLAAVYGGYRATH